MAIGERIKFIRNLRGITQRTLGIAIGFPKATADIRIAQYETGNRSPKSDITTSIASILKVSPKALDVPDIDTYDGLMHTFFALEDLYGIKIDRTDGELSLKLSNDKGTASAILFDNFSAWADAAEKLKSGEMSKEEYDNWRYNSPKYDTFQRKPKSPRQDL
ncbi:MAG: helix-turn-helix domain-containing protein [Clostridia bacterium]|nr:helix-turn-helix domain-containing protein [Clostridia bacterium]